MRRKEREITDHTTLEEILHKAWICRLGMSADDQPYVIPLCFGYRDGTLYVHCAQEGLKIDMLKKNNRVCFEVDGDHELIRGESACEWGMKGRSVVGFGRAHLINDPEGKTRALDAIMEHYGAKRPFAYKDKGFEKALVIKVVIERLTGKKVG